MFSRTVVRITVGTGALGCSVLDSTWRNNRDLAIYRGEGCIVSVDPLLIRPPRGAYSAISALGAGETTDPRDLQGEAWDIVADIGLPWVSIPESAGGSGGTIEDAIAV